MRTSPATRIAVVFFAVAALTPLEAFGQCDDGEKGTMSQSCFTCTGSDWAQQPICTFNHQSRTRTLCRDSIWKSKLDYPWESTTKNSFGQCGGANLGGQPQCPAVERAWTHAVSGSTVTFTITTVAGLVDPPGGTGCKDGDRGNKLGA